MSDSVPTPSQSIGRAWLFRLGAVALGLSPFLAIEVLLIAANAGQIDPTTDPFIGFDGQRPLFERRLETGDYQISPERYQCFCPDGFAAEKDSREYRVFCLGGSTVQGRPYAIETSFTTWLELSWQAADPSRTYDVVNCGGISYASYRLAPILQEVLEYEPDLIILYMGHNEFLEDRTYRDIKERTWLVNTTLRYATELRIFNVLHSCWVRWRGLDDPSPTRARLPVEVEARLDYQGGLALYDRDPVWRQGIVAHFDRTLRRMIDLCQNADVPVWIVDPVCNLSNCPPFKSMNRDRMSEDDRAQWRGLRDQAREHYRSNLYRAVSLLEKAEAIDDQHAGVAYDLAKCYQSMGRFDEARSAYRRAKELDICPLRLTEPLRRVIHAASRRAGIPLIEVDALFRKHCDDGIPGGYLLVDHVHPSITGHQMIADLMTQHRIDDGTLSPEPDWRKRRDRLFADHLATLGDKYYLQGARRLDGLRRWAAGRSDLRRDDSASDAVTESTEAREP